MTESGLLVLGDGGEMKGAGGKDFKGAERNFAHGFYFITLITGYKLVKILKLYPLNMHSVLYIRYQQSC